MIFQVSNIMDLVRQKYQGLLIILYVKQHDLEYVTRTEYESTSTTINYRTVFHITSGIRETDRCKPVLMQ